MGYGSVIPKYSGLLIGLVTPMYRQPALLLCTQLWYTFIVCGISARTANTAVQAVLAPIRKGLIIVNTHNIVAGTPFQLALADVDESVDINPRSNGLNEAHIKSLMVDTPDTYPPIEVIPSKIPGKYYRVAGYHRYEAAKRQKASTIPAVLITGDLNAYDTQHPDEVPSYAEIQAYRSNIMHGLPMTVSDKKYYAWLLYLNNKNATYREIGKQVKLSDKTVKAAILDHIREEENSTPAADDTNDDITYKAMTSHTAKFGKSLVSFFTNESAMFSKDLTGKRSENVRSKALAKYYRTEGYGDTMPVLLQSLARSLDQAATLLTTDKK